MGLLAVRWRRWLDARARPGPMRPPTSSRPRSASRQPQRSVRARSQKQRAFSVPCRASQSPADGSSPNA
eukprot:11202747-Lingulodinium_polyedra.AAC.1